MYENAQDYEPVIAMLEKNRRRAAHYVMFVTLTIVLCLLVVVGVCGYGAWCSEHNVDANMTVHGISLWFVSFICLLMVFMLKRFQEMWHESHRYWRKRVHEMQERQARQQLIDDALLLNEHQIPLAHL